jgi:hypothetical protein
MWEQPDFWYILCKYEHKFGLKNSIPFLSVLLTHNNLHNMETDEQIKNEENQKNNSER